MITAAKYSSAPLLGAVQGVANTQRASTTLSVNHLRTSLGIRFAERPNPDPRLRPAREVVGVKPALNARWSTRRADIETRRADIETRRGELAADVQHTQ